MESTIQSMDREPAVAGKFYPANPDKLQLELASLFADAEPKKHNHIRALIVPHAGYMYSGMVAASAFNQLDSKISYKRVFLIGSSHIKSFDMASVYCDGDFVMPYGKEKVDTTFGNMLVQCFPEVFTSDSSAHEHEHCLEVQLPFLHYALKTNYTVVPIIIGTNNPATCRQIANALQPYLNPDNLFVISTDFSHYPEYHDACKVDDITQKAILTNDPDTLLATLSENAKKHIPHLSTSLCGWTSVLTLMDMTSHDKTLEYHAINYCNSGDNLPYGDRSSVVGYWGITLSEIRNGKDEFNLLKSDKETLLRLARRTVEDHCRFNKKYMPDTTRFSETLNMKCGAFVTLHNKGKLRGCIGQTTSNLPLYKLVQEMAILAATHDSRFPPVETGELVDIEIEISVLSPLRKIENIEEFELGKHGVLIKEGYHSGLFLPQVATETGWNTEEFLGHCAHDKAGLPWDGWKTAHIYIFTATVFS